MNDIVSPVQNISYTNKDFKTIYEELLDLAKNLGSKWDPSLSNESDPGVILLKLNAVIADKCNYNIDKSVLECFPLSVTQITNARQLFEQLGYYMKWRQSATTKVTMNWIGNKTYDYEYATIQPFTMVTDSENTIIYTLLGTYDEISDYNVSEMKLLCNGASSSAVLCNAIQGVPVQLTVSGNRLITVENLDANNRLYFPDTVIAENGIFITNAGEGINYNKWQRKNNLLVENYNNYYYRFGVNKEGTNCYIEFPEDVERLFGEGIYVTYIRTDSEYGNISSGYLSKFYDSITASLGGENVILTSDVISITNNSAASNGTSYEDINEAYRNYKNVVGTFNTLVTLRDYIGAIIESGFVSNAFVCDRTNDVQTTYNVVTSTNNIEQKYTYIEDNTYVEDDVEKTVPYMNAFSIKLYLLKYAASTSDLSSFRTSFDMMTDEDINVVNLKKYIEDLKIIPHDYESIIDPGDLFPHVAYFRNIYPVECTITTQSTLNNQQKQEIRNNIIRNLYNNLSSKDLNFGDAIEYDLVYNLISESDPRIKYVSLFNMNYSTQAVYLDSNSKITYDATAQKWFDSAYNVVNPKDYNLDVVDPIDGATLTLPATFKYEYINGDLYDDVYFCSNTKNNINDTLVYIPKNQRSETLQGTVDINPSIYYNKVGIDKCYRLLRFEVDSITFEKAWFLNDKEVDLSDYGITIDSSSDPKVGDTLTVQFNSTISNIDPSYESESATTPSVEVDFDTFISYMKNSMPHTSIDEIVFECQEVTRSPIWNIYDDSTDELIEDEVSTDTLSEDFGITITTVESIALSDQFKVRLSYGHQVKYDTISKSILAGTTQFYIKDETFDYRLNQIAHYFNDPNEVVEEGQTPTKIPYIPDVAKLRGNVDITFTQDNTVYELRENESLQFYSPNLIEQAKYSNYVKFEYYITKSLEANSNYQLRNNEFIIFYWTESDNDAGVSYHYQCYGAGNIICPSFSLPLLTTNEKDNLIATKKDYNIVQYDSQNNTINSSWSKTAMLPYGASQEIAKIKDSKQILSGSKTISIKVANQFTIDRNSNYYLYWIVNNTTINTFNQQTYVLFNVGKADRMLQAGEYVIYTDVYKKNYEILGEGTQLVRNNTTTEWAVKAINSSNVLTNGLDALDNNWFVLGDGETLTVVENAFTNIGSGCMVSIVAGDPKTNFYTPSYRYISDGTTLEGLAFESSLWYSKYISAGTYRITYDGSDWYVSYNGQSEEKPTNLADVGITLPSSITPAVDDYIEIDIEYSYRLVFNKDGYSIYIPQSSDETTTNSVYLSDFIIKYKLAGDLDVDSNWVTIDNVTLNNTINWNGRSLLAVNIGPDNPQYLLSNQSILLTNKDDNELDPIIGANKTFYVTKSSDVVDRGENVVTEEESAITEIDFSVDNDIWNNKNTAAGSYEYTYKLVSEQDEPEVYEWQNAVGVAVDLSSLGITINTPSTDLLNGDKIIITNSAPLHYPTVILGSSSVTSYGNDDVLPYYIEYDNWGNTTLKYLSLYVYTEILSTAGETIYGSSGTVSLIFSPNPDEQSTKDSKTISFNLPAGEYILPVKNNNSELDSIEIFLDATSETYNETTQLYPIWDKNKEHGNLKLAKTYYLKMNLTGIEDHTLTMIVKGHKMQVAVLLDNVYKYVKPNQFDKVTNEMSDSEFGLIEERIMLLDKEHRYKYDYIVDSVNAVANPIDAQSFNSINHIYNRYTICEFSYANIS